MYQLVDTATDKVISNHRTAYTAGKAGGRYAKAFRKRYENTSGAYLPLALRNDGQQCAEYEVDDFYRGLEDARY